MSASWVDQDGTTRLVGTIVGGGVATPQVETYTGPVVINAGAAALSFAHAAGAALLDYTDPTAPAFIAAGTYAITLFVSPDAGYVGKVATVTLQLPDITVAQAAPLDNVSLFGGFVVISVTLPFVAGDQFGSIFTHNVGGPAGFQPQGYVARLF